MILYLDTSALLKIYLDEPGSESVVEAFETAATVVTHMIAYAEVRAAFAKAVTMERVSQSGAARYRRAFENHWQGMEIVNVNESLVFRAGDLADEFGLRGYDSVHLAAVEWTQRVLGTQTPLLFGVFDGDLKKAAQQLKVTTL